jgi:hypothetical protein
MHLRFCLQRSREGREHRTAEIRHTALASVRRPVSCQFIPGYLPSALGLGGPKYKILKSFPRFVRLDEHQNLLHQFGVLRNHCFEFS